MCDDLDGFRGGLGDWNKDLPGVPQGLCGLYYLIFTVFWEVRIITSIVIAKKAVCQKLHALGQLYSNSRICLTPKSHKFKQPPQGCRGLWKGKKQGLFSLGLWKATAVTQGAAMCSTA